MLGNTRLRHMSGTKWDNKKYMNMKHLKDVVEGISFAGWLHLIQNLQTNLRKAFDITKMSFGNLGLY